MNKAFLLKNLQTTRKQRREIIQLGKEQDTFEHVSGLLDENKKYEKLILEALSAGEGTVEQIRPMDEMDAFNVRQFLEATAKIEKDREFFEATAGPEKTREFCEATARLEIAQKEKQRIDAKLEKALENKRKAATKLKEAMKNERKGK